MATARLRSSGRWEIALRHPKLPGGRKYFSFDTEAAANAYAEHWRMLKQGGIDPPAELLEPGPSDKVMLGVLLRNLANSGLPSAPQQVVIGVLMREVGGVRLVDATYTWLLDYIRGLKTRVRNLSPNTIRQRVQAIGRAIDEYLRHNPRLVHQNPVRLLPKGYSAYSEVDGALAVAAGEVARVDVVRDRRLHPGEHERIVAALSGHRRPDRERALELQGGNALLTMYLLIVHSGLRLREAYRLTRGAIDLATKIIRVQSSKQRRGRVVFRDVPMRPDVHAALLDYLSTRNLLPAADLFPFQAEEPDLSLKKVSSRLSARFASAFAYAECDGLREHDLRHEATCQWLEMRDSTGSWMWRSEEINRIMGWSPGSVMAQRYASFRGSDLAQRMWQPLEDGSAVNQA